MSGGVAAARLAQERKSWRKDHPFGFVAKPMAKADGSTDMFRWTCAIPGKAGTLWEGGLYPLTLHFSEEYPAKPPVCRFHPGFLHPNVFTQGDVCLSIINPNKGWRPNITVKQVLTGIQELLHNPNLNDPANQQAWRLCKDQPMEYEKLVKKQRRTYAMEKQT